MEKVIVTVTILDETNGDVSKVVLNLSKGDIDMLAKYDKNGGRLEKGDAADDTDVHISLSCRKFKLVEQMPSCEDFILSETGKLAIVELKKMRKIE